MTKKPLLTFCFLAAVAVAAASIHTFAQAANAAPSTNHDWPMFGLDVARSSSLPGPTGIDAHNVASLQRQAAAIDGTSDASVIYLHGVRVSGGAHDAFFLTTEYGKTLAIDADTGKTLWAFTPPGYGSWVGSRQITNSTPVADPGRGFIYAASPDGHVQKLAVADGHVVWSTAITKLAQREKIASPLAFFRGHVVAVTAGYIGDAPPYQGHVAILDGASGKLLQVWNSLCSDRHELLDPGTCAQTRSAIWGRAGAVIDPASGDIFLTTGNGPWDGKTSWGDAVLQLGPDARQLIGNYTPTNTEELNARDADLGSTSPALLGDGLIAQGGKDGLIRVLSLDEIRGAAAHRGGELQAVSTPSGGRLFTAPAVVHEGTTTWLIAADGGGTAAWKVSGRRLEPAWHNTNAGTSPVVAGGLLYVYDPAGTLRVYEPTTGRVVASLPCGGGHWNSPIVVDGRIALPEGNANRHAAQGVLSIWRLPAAN